MSPVGLSSKSAANFLFENALGLPVKSRVGAVFVGARRERSLSAESRPGRRLVGASATAGWGAFLASLPSWDRLSKASARRLAGSAAYLSHGGHKTDRKRDRENSNDAGKATRVRPRSEQEEESAPLEGSEALPAEIHRRAVVPPGLGRSQPPLRLVGRAALLHLRRQRLRPIHADPVEALCCVEDAQQRRHRGRPAGDGGRPGGGVEREGIEHADEGGDALRWLSGAGGVSVHYGSGSAWSDELLS